MNLKKQKHNLITIAILSIFATSLIMIPNANAHSPPWTVVSYAYMTASPNPVGVGQTTDIVMWVEWPMPNAAITNDIRRHDYTLTITKPDGTAETKQWDVVTDSTSIQFYQYTPDQVGNYTLKFDYDGQTYTWSGEYQNDTLKAASRTLSLTVQDEPIPASRDTYPLPTEYWDRPIEGQNTYWYSIASNWLGAPYITGANPAVGLPGAFQPDGLAPNSAHIMWTKPIQFGGVVGGDTTANLGDEFYTGLSYNTRFNNPLIIQGILFYPEPYGNAGTGGDYIAVDLTTGEEIWRIKPTAGIPTFGYLYSFENPNQHGVLPNGLLIAPSTSGGVTRWAGYDPRTGALTTMNITNIPSGISASGPSGEYLIYTLKNYGTSQNPNWYLAQWNSSKVFGTGTGSAPSNWYLGTVDASTSSCYDWNLSITLGSGEWRLGTGGLRGAIPLVSYNNILLLLQGTFGGHAGVFAMFSTVSLDPANITAISLKPQSLGQQLWTKSYPQAPNNITRTIANWDPNNDVFIFEDTETMLHYGYSLTNGGLLWGPTELVDDKFGDWSFLSLDNDVVAYGNLYYHGYGGVLHCYDVKTGDLKWTYGNGLEGNSTLSGSTTPYGHHPIFVSVVADGKVYLSTTEHSPTSPKYKGAEYRCINATDGTELWTIMNYGNAMYGGVGAVADGYLTCLNTYDMQIYCISKGPSSITVEAPMTAVTEGSSVVIRGTIIDIAAGTTQIEQAARFPNGVPAVSDASQSAWMEYVYMQKPKPTDVTGVPITLSVVDSNGNYRQIGTTTSNDGFFTFNWTPDITGQYIVYASFSGSDSYWPSSAMTSFAVDPAPATPAPTEAPIQSMADTYLLPGIIAIIVAIIVVGLVLLFAIRKRP